MLPASQLSDPTFAPHTTLSTMERRDQGNAPSADDSDKSESLSLAKSEKNVPSEIEDIADKAKVRKAILKMDLTLLPIMTMFYLLAFLVWFFFLPETVFKLMQWMIKDRTNIGMFLRTFKVDIFTIDVLRKCTSRGSSKKLADYGPPIPNCHNHDLCVCVYVVWPSHLVVLTNYRPYILSEVPANLLIRKIGPHFFMPTILTIWGLIVISQGFVTSFRGLVVARAFLGLVEGPMFPGIVLYLSGFYTREELSLRVALFFSAASVGANCLMSKNNMLELYFSHHSSPALSLDCWRQLLSICMV